ncbi:choice-of-anchor Q domain-containing protein [Actinoallomurus sp. CA-142502]|uniref:choice-of-anchor Q domain-containing protein n=1 Tax=Actinoallomurus sp. CA-142502 TaxID=3239885 RepID=UPI003D8F9F9F
MCRKSSLPRAVASALVALAVVAAVVAGVVTRPARATAPPHDPLLGVNMSFYGANDALVTQTGTRELFRSWGVPFVRVPLRDHFDDAGKTPVGDDLLMSAMRAVKNVGATPLLIIRGPGEGGTAEETKAADLHLLKLVHQVFGEDPAYLEFGNEPDRADVSAADYTAAWNAVVPALKAAYPNDRYVGPVASRADHEFADYVADFAAGAKPAPDYLSWHEYVCGASTDGDWKNTCVSHLANWQNHVKAIEDKVQAKLGRTLPYFISEWNADPEAGSPVYDDANAGYLAAWTSKAIAQLRALTPAPAGAMIYTATDHQNFGLVTGVDTVTTQGKAFQAALTGDSVSTLDSPGSPDSPESPQSPGTQDASASPASPDTQNSPKTPGPDASGDQYYVATDGDDKTGDGSQAHPWATIQHAAEQVKVASGGATVHVADGTYKDAVENKTSGHAGGHLTFVADHRWKAKIAPTSSAIPFENRGDYVRIEGFDVTSAGGAWSGILTWGAHNIVQGNHVHDIRTEIGSGDCTGSPGGDGIGDDGSSSDNAFVGNQVDHIGPYPRECQYIHGIYPSGANDIIQDNVTYNSSGSGIRFNHNATGATITNNLSFANADHGIFISGGVDATADKFVISNNIVLDNAMFGINVRSDANGANNEFHDNLLWGNKKGTYGKDSSEEFTPPNSSGTLSEDPKLVDYRDDGTGDYHLTASSPCVDAGTDSGAPDADYDGVSRPQGHADDIGPYELSAGTGSKQETTT